MAQKFKSFGITVRPRAGMSSKLQLAMVSWLDKQPYAVAVTEMEDEAKHLHAQVWYDKARTKSDVLKQIQRICEKSCDTWDAAQTKVMRGGIRIAYSDWYDSYLLNNPDKEGEPNILMERVPDRTMDYYPSEEEQEACQHKVADPVNQKMYDEFKEWYPTHYEKDLDITKVTVYNVAEFLADSCYISKTRAAATQQRDRTAVCQNLYAYIVGEVSQPKDLMRMFLTKEHMELLKAKEEMIATSKEVKQNIKALQELDLT